MKILKKLTFISFIICITQTACVQSNDWTKWRGPAGDGSSPETNWSPDSLSSENIIWKTKVGMGHSAVVVKDNKLYATGNYMLADSTYKDVVVCLNTDSGDEIWKFEYPCFEHEDPGPFSSPMIDDGFLYTLSREGHLFCFDAENGNVIWMQNLLEKGYTKSDKEFENQYSSTPSIHNNLIILNQNHHGIAFNKMNGDLVWNSEIQKNGLSTPVFCEFNQKTYMVIQNEKNTMLVNPETGEQSWALDCNSAADPIVIDNKLIVAFYKGFRKYSIEANKAELLWTNTAPKCSFQSFVKDGNYIYGFGNRNIQCISLEDGSVKWKQAMKGGSLIIANGTLIILEKEGKLSMVEASAEAYKEISSIQAITNPEAIQHPEGYRRWSACWTNPVLCNGKIYLRNTYGDLVCVNVGS